MALFPAPEVVLSGCPWAPCAAIRSTSSLQPSSPCPMLVRNLSELSLEINVCFRSDTQACKTCSHSVYWACNCSPAMFLLYVLVIYLLWVLLELKPTLILFFRPQAAPLRPWQLLKFSFSITPQTWQPPDWQQPGQIQSSFSPVGQPRAPHSLPQPNRQRQVLNCPSQPVLPHSGYLGHDRPCPNIWRLELTRLTSLCWVLTEARKKIR